VRVSTQEQAAGTSLADQCRRIEGAALMRGETLATVFSEEGVSGSTELAKRPEGAKLCHQLTAGDVLIVAKLDRIFRNAADALSASEAWREAGVQLVVCDMGSEPVTGHGAGRMFFGLLALVAEFERERMLERTRDGRRSKAAKGGHIGGSAPFGYRVEGIGRDARLVPVPEHLEALQTVRAADGRLSLRALQRLVRERHGIQISHEAIRRIRHRATHVAAV
jgi:DNA invertase Pin-like site-specific DNA recombinase